MLAKTPQALVYLTAAELGITDRERAGLIAVRDDLASGRVKHVLFDSCGRSGGSRDLFNMLHFEGYTNCGTCHCIGGFMKIKGYINSYQSMDFADDGWSILLKPLFFPRGGITGDETVAQAVRAIDAFLNGAGADCWPQALADLPA